MKLLNGYILIKVDEVKEKTESGLYLPGNTQKLPNSGVVEAVADDVTMVEPGDTVLFLRYAAIDGSTEDTRLCKEEHLIGIQNDG